MPDEPIGENWAGTFVYSASSLVQPTSIENLQDIVASTERIKALGTRHSFSDVADTTGVLVDLSRLAQNIAINTDARTVTVSAAMRYGDVATRLQRAGWALHNLGSLPHISVAGAIATGTHGSGTRNGSLATAVQAIEFVTANGELACLERGEPDFDGAVIALGALGIVIRVTLNIEPTYDVTQTVYTGLTFNRLVADFAAIFASGYSVSSFTDWSGDSLASTWVKSRRKDDQLVGAVPLASPVHMIDGKPARNTTQQLGVPGPWHERLPHFRMEYSPSFGAEIQTEYLLPIHNAGEAIEALRALGPQLKESLLVSEIRTVAGDNLWLSPGYDRVSLAVHFTWARDVPAVASLLPLIEERLLPLGARPHWGKVFGTTSIATLYPRFGDFRDLRNRLDPGHKFGNAYLARYGIV